MNNFIKINFKQIRIVSPVLSSITFIILFIICDLNPVFKTVNTKKNTNKSLYGNEKDDGEDLA